MNWEPLPISSFPAWALLQDISFNNVALSEVPDKGIGITTSVDVDGDKQETTPIKFLEIPADLVLSSEAVAEYAKVDQNFKALLEKMGRQVSSVSGDKTGRRSFIHRAAPLELAHQGGTAANTQL